MSFGMVSSTGWIRRRHALETTGPPVGHDPGHFWARKPVRLTASPAASYRSAFP